MPTLSELQAQLKEATKPGLRAAADFISSPKVAEVKAEAEALLPQLPDGNAKSVLANLAKMIAQTGQVIEHERKAAEA